MESALVCALCASRLFPKMKGSSSAQDPFKLIPCGHVFHRECTEKWGPTCPTCRANVQNGRKVFSAEDSNSADDYPGSDEEDQQRSIEDAQGYEKYVKAFLFAGGAVVGVLAARAVAATVSKKSDKEEEEKK